MMMAALECMSFHLELMLVWSDANSVHNDRTEDCKHKFARSHLSGQCSDSCQDF